MKNLKLNKENDYHINGKIADLKLKLFNNFRRCDMFCFIGSTILFVDLEVSETLIFFE